MRVLLTGASGFLGGAIAERLLSRGDQLVAVQRSAAPALQARGVHVVQADLGDPEQLPKLQTAAKDCDAILHVAALAGHWGDYQTYFRANVLATQHVLQIARAQGVQRFVYTSTPSVAHAGGDLNGVDESTPIPTHFAAHYPATKAKAEAMVLAANGADLASCALRPHLIWGPGDQHLLPRLVARARAGRLKFIGPAKLIDSIYIDNAADAHLLALDRLQPGAACAGKAYFLSNDQPMLLDELVNRLLACAELGPVHARVPVWVAKSVGTLLEYAYRFLPLSGEPLMTRFVAEQLSTAHYYDISAAKRDLDYRATVSIESGLARLRTHLRLTKPAQLG